MSATPQYHTLYDRYVALLAVARAAAQVEEFSNRYPKLDHAIAALERDHPDWRTWP